MRIAAGAPEVEEGEGALGISLTAGPNFQQHFYPDARHTSPFLFVEAAFTRTATPFPEFLSSSPNREAEMEPRNVMVYILIQKASSAAKHLSSVF
jgi:hypothetical protein